MQQFINNSEINVDLQILKFFAEHGVNLLTPGCLVRTRRRIEENKGEDAVLGGFYFDFG